MADVFEDRLRNALAQLRKARPEQTEVKDDHCFVGFDGYQKVIASGVDVVLLATPPGNGMQIPGTVIAPSTDFSAASMAASVITCVQCKPPSALCGSSGSEAIAGDFSARAPAAASLERKGPIVNRLYEGMFLLDNQVVREDWKRKKREDLLSGDPKALTKWFNSSEGRVWSTQKRGKGRSFSFGGI